MKKILLVEDDLKIRDSIQDYLERNGFTTATAGSLAEARKAMTAKFDCVVLDWALPDGEGIELAQELSRNRSRTPILMLTARAETIDKIVGLESGANDYLTKPFEPRELLVRIKNLIRMSQPESGGAAESVIEMHGVTVNLTERTVVFDKNTVDLTMKEFDLLKILMQNPGKAFSRDELLGSVWGYDDDQFPTTRTVDTHILQLRNKISESLIETVRGVGYKCRKP